MIKNQESKIYIPAVKDTQYYFAQASPSGVRRHSK